MLRPPPHTARRQPRCTFNPTRACFPALAPSLLRSRADDAINGRPSCANDYILKSQLREAWDSPDAFISTDCGAVKNMRGAPANAPTDEAAVSWTINNGTDLEMGTSLVHSALGNALAQGLITEATIIEAARRTLVHLFAAGRFDRIADIEWSKYGADDVASDLHHQIRDEAALQSFVLLKNEKESLPLKAGTKVAVIGALGLGLIRPQCLRTAGLVSSPPACASNC